MEDFTTITRLTKNDYARFMYSSFYKQPKFILLTTAGVYLILTALLTVFGFSNYYTGTPYFELISGTFILLGPAIIILIALKGFTSSPSLQHGIKYTFKPDGITVEGLTFKSELAWAHIIKQKETKKFLLLYSTKKAGNFIDKSTMTPEQIQFIRSKVGQK